MIESHLLIFYFIIGFVINILFITYTLGPVMRYIVKPLYHKSWKKDHKKYRKEFSFFNLFEDAFILMYFLFAIPIIFVCLLCLITMLFSQGPLIVNIIINRILILLGIFVLGSFGWYIIEHEEHMKKRFKKKIKMKHRKKKSK